MAELRYRGNLQSSLFPLLSTTMGRTVIVGERDQVYVPGVNPADSTQAVDRGVPQLYYAHNVMPTTNGYQSVGYRAYLPQAPENVNFRWIEYLFSDKAYLGIAQYSGTDALWIVNRQNQWVRLLGVPLIGMGTQISIATINGESYICVGYQNVYKILPGSMVTNPTAEVVVLEGLEVGSVGGILASSGYMVTWSPTGLAWSSATDPLDFVPSDVTGAGAGELQDAKGRIVTAKETDYGFVVYTTGNAVSSIWSGNVNYPWRFRAITGAGGIIEEGQVCQGPTGQHFAYTNYGLQQVHHTGAKSILPYISDFLSGDEFEDFDEATNTFVTLKLVAPMRKKVKYLNSRYLMVSYGPYANGPYTHVIVVDMVQTRMGKLRLLHEDTFPVWDEATALFDPARDSIALLKNNGESVIVNFDVLGATDGGVAILGKYQAVRNNMVQVSEVEIENVRVGPGIEVYIIPTLDGKNLLGPVLGFPDPDTVTGLLKKYYFDVWGKNHNLLVKGAFDMNSLQFLFNVDGRR